MRRLLARLRYRAMLRRYGLRLRNVESVHVAMDPAMEGVPGGRATAIVLAAQMRDGKIVVLDTWDMEP